MSTTRFQPGEFLDGRMEIIKAVRGGVGEVYLCIDRHNDQPLALKRLQTRYAAMPRFREAFRREAQTWIDLGRHPNIVPCLVLQNIYDEPFLVLEWIFGPDGGEPDLGKLMRGQRLDLRAVIAMAIDVSRGLVHAASCVPSIVHCDLKPANILIGAQGEALITDFGLAKSAVDAAIPASDVAPQSDSDLNPAAGGTPRYMAPEQWTGSELDARTDVYALACIVFEALSGHPVYPGPALEDFRRQHLTAPAPALERPGAGSQDGQFGALIARCLAKDKEARPTPSDLLSGLTDIHQRLFGEPPAQRTFVSAPSARDLNNRAVTLHSLGRAEEAVGLYRQALEMNPSYAFARSNLAATLMSLGRLDEAWSEVNRAIDDDPSGAEAYANRAGIHAVREEPAEALADFQRAIDRNPRLALAHVGRAKVYHRTGRREEALAEVEAATRIDPLDAAAWLARGELLDELGRSEDALESFSRAIEVGGGSAMAYLRRSLMYLGSGEERLAVEDLTAAIAQDTKLYPAYLLRAHAQRNLYQSTSDPERLSAAMRDYSRAIELNPSKAYAAYVERGKILFDDFQEEAAIADLTRAIEIDPEGLHAYLQRARAYIDIALHDKAIADLAHVLASDAENYDALLALGQAYRGARGLKSAVAAYGRAIAVNANRAEAFMHRSEARLELGHARAALRDANRAIELAPDWAKAYGVRSEIHQALGNAQASARDFAQCLTSGARFTTIELSDTRGPPLTGEGEKARAPDPDDTVPEIPSGPAGVGRDELRMHAEVLFAAGRYADAVTAFDRLIEAGETSPETYVRRGFAKVRTGAVAAGIEDYARALAADPSFAPAYNNRGVAYRALGRPDSAIAEFDRAIELDPGYAMAYINRGGAYQEINQGERALADLTRGIELDPNNPEGYADRGAVYGNLNRFNEALADLKRALELDADYAGGHYTLGAVLAKRGDFGEALQAFERAAALGMQEGAGAAELVRRKLSRH